ncbi:PEP-CTERM/exosortase system-associated acyltransferase [Halomonas sp. ISL-60]|uniref:PEP-CTERM/exosortase system-associated acyltransferase n=1 Tax=Halomonas sp. ISL-56 TaxID=2819149 RepID=UPI001BE8EC45|nr:PEP-CTERM/exosortase system-associated acyltransferase [Halomonas sp. ISL-56]MBT2774708.1 PEP-CTERM/exosortase system-associated acyltransferase [Halomonas sp. ISL-60]MBT2803526.1 PEP-CTERM/exosortase system-associated acyltransferase [Halomonas sp. ISL-56]
MSTKKTKISEPTILLPKLSIDPYHFFKNFNFIIAHSPDEKQRAFLLRHQVFNEELNYNIGDKISSTLEKDSYDQHSILCLLQHRESGIDVGCLRVVVIDQTIKSFPQTLPLEEYCLGSLTSSDFHPEKMAKNTICEVSRLAVHPLFRNKKKSPVDSKELHIKKRDINHDTKNQSIISLSLFLAATALVGLAHRRHVFAMLEPRFNRLLKASGLHFQQVGNIINYCGNRAAYYIDQKIAVESLPQQLIPFYAHIEKELAIQTSSEKTHKTEYN